MAKKKQKKKEIFIAIKYKKPLIKRGLTVMQGFSVWRWPGVFSTVNSGVSHACVVLGNGCGGSGDGQRRI